MPTNLDYSDVTHTGTHRFERSPDVPAGSFGDSEMDSGDPVACDKLDHQYAPVVAQLHGTASTDERRAIHVAKAAGVVESARAGVVVAAVGDSTVTVDIKKNGTTVLTGVISIDSGDAGYAKVDGAIDEEDYVAGDVFEVVIDATVGTGTLPQGLFAQVIFREGSG